jgi:putative transposase
VKYAWIKEHRDSFPVAAMCRVLAVSRSGYYSSLGRAPSTRQQRREAISQAAEEAYWREHGIPGHRKVHEELVEQQIECCRETVRKVLAEKRLFSRVKRKFVATTDSNHARPVAENLLAQDFEADAPNQKWTADITYIPTREGWLYLAVVMDLFSRRIVGWSMSASLETTVVLDAMQAALVERKPEPGLLHHSDRGCQYASHSFQELLDGHGITCSMSRRGNCYDNAPTESFFGKLKTEWTNFQNYTTHEEARQHIFEYIELYYNRRRKHASLDYQTPVKYEELYCKNKPMPQTAA